MVNQNTALFVFICLIGRDFAARDPRGFGDDDHDATVLRT